MASPCVTTVGLTLDIIGVVLLWRFGLPEAISRGGFGYLALEGEDEAEKAKARRYDMWARIGLTLIIGGFSLQLLAAWL